MSNDRDQKQLAYIDDVLDESSTQTPEQRARLIKWWDDVKGSLLNRDGAKVEITRVPWHRWEGPLK